MYGYDLNLRPDERIALKEIVLRYLQIRSQLCKQTSVITLVRKLNEAEPEDKINIFEDIKTGKIEVK